MVQYLITPFCYVRKKTDLHRNIDTLFFKQKIGFSYKSFSIDFQPAKIVRVPEIPAFFRDMSADFQGQSRSVGWSGRGFQGRNLNIFSPK